MLRKPAAALGGFYATSLDSVRFAFHRPFQTREFLAQAWFIAGVCLAPTLLMSVPFCVITVFQLNQLLIELGGADLSGAGAGLGVVREIAPLVSALVVAGSGATAICADLGARQIREEIDAVRTLGLHPVHRLVVPRLLAATVVALGLNGMVTLFGLLAGYFFSVYVQHASPGLFAANLTLLTGPRLCRQRIQERRLRPARRACRLPLGLTAKGGPKGVGDAVNQTVVCSFLLLFLANSLITALFLRS